MTSSRILRYGPRQACPVCAAAGAGILARTRCAYLEDEQGSTLYLCATATADVPGFRLVSDDGRFLGARVFRATNADAPPLRRTTPREDELDPDQAQPTYASLVELVRTHAQANLPVARAEVERRGLAWSDHFLARPTATEELTILAELERRHPELRRTQPKGLKGRRGDARLPTPTSLGGELWIVPRDAEQRPVGILRRLLGTITDGGGKYRLIGSARAAFVGLDGGADSLLIAEGPIKAMIAAQHVAMPAAAVPSVVIARAVRDDLHAYIERVRPRCVHLAPDAGDLRDGHPDVEKAVRASWRRLARFSASRGAEVLWGWWDREKGIDDALVAGVAVEWLSWSEFAARWATPPAANDADEDSRQDADELTLIDEPSVEADPQVVRECLALADAQVRVRELIDAASRHRHSLDLAGVAGCGKSFAAVESEVDRLAANHDKLQGHPLAVITIGGGRELAVERHSTIAARIQELGMSDEVAVVLGLGRQALEVGEHVRKQLAEDPAGLFAKIDTHSAPHGFACPMLQESAQRSRAGFHGCAGCPFEPGGAAPSLCESTPGAFLHDWAEVRRTTIAGPTFLVMTQSAAAANFHSRVNRDGPDVRWMLDDADDVHAGVLTEFVLTKETLAGAAATAEMGRHALSRQAPIEGKSPLQPWIERLEGRCNSVGVADTLAEPTFVAWLLAETLPAIAPVLGPAGEWTAPAPEALGEALQQLARNGPLREYVISHSFGARQAWTAYRDRWRAPVWRGIGIGARVWRMLRDMIEHGAHPTVFGAGEGDVRVVTADQHLLAASRSGRVTRLGTAPLPAFVRKAFGIACVHELLVPVRSRVLAVKHPRGGSWGRRARPTEEPSPADRLAAAIAADMQAAHPGRFLLVGGLRDAVRAAGRYPVAVAGRDDRATNQWKDALDALVIRRLAPPATAVHCTVSALLAGLGLARPGLDAEGDVPMGRTPLGARLPVDPQVRQAWLAGRASSVRNGIGRARAVQCDAPMRLVALDRDLERWPDLILPGYRVAVCSVDRLAVALGVPTPITDAERRTQRASHDPRPERSAERRDQVAAAEAAGATTLRDLAAATGLSRETVRRFRERERPGVPSEGIYMREVRVFRARALAKLSHEQVLDLALACNVHVSSVRRWRTMARRLVAGEQLGPRAIAALRSALCVLADMPFASPDEPPAEPASGPDTPSESKPGAVPPTELDLLVDALTARSGTSDPPAPGAIVDRLPLGSPTWRLSRPSARRTVSRLLPALGPAAQQPRRPRTASTRSHRAADVTWAMLELRPDPELAGIDAAAALEMIRGIVDAGHFGEEEFRRVLAIAAAASAGGEPGVVMEAFRETVAAANPAEP